MAGTKAGGDKVKNKMLLKNPNYYREIGRKFHTQKLAFSIETLILLILQAKKVEA